MVSGAASSAVTTRGTPLLGGTASDGACTRSTGPSRGTGPNGTGDVPGVVEQGPRQGQDHRLGRIEAIRMHGPLDAATRMTRGEADDLDLVVRQPGRELGDVAPDPARRIVEELLNTERDAHRHGRSASAR